MISITKRFSFDAAHHLPNYVGPCHNLHGHRWVLDVEVSGEISKQSGMIMDFSILKKIINDLIIDKLDHHCLNDEYPNPTAEMMVLCFSQELAPPLKAQGVDLVRLRLYETPEAFCEWRNI